MHAYIVHRLFTVNVENSEGPKHSVSQVLKWACLEKESLDSSASLQSAT